MFAVVTADGAIVQEHTAKGLDGLAPPGTVQSILGQQLGSPKRGRRAPVRGAHEPVHPAGAPSGTVLSCSSASRSTTRLRSSTCRFSEPRPTRSSVSGSVTRISSPALNLPVDLAPVKRDTDDPNWASNTTLDEDSDFYVANRGDNTIVRMKQDGTVVAIRRVTVDGIALKFVNLNGIATSTDGNKIYVTFTGPDICAFAKRGPRVAGVLDSATAARPRILPLTRRGRARRARYGRAGPRGGPSKASSPRAARSGRDGAAGRPGCRCRSTSGRCRLAGTPSARP